MKMNESMSTILSARGIASLLMCLTLIAAVDASGETNTDDYRLLRIIEPEENQRIDHPGEFSVIAELEPNIRSGHRFQLVVDDQEYRSPNMEGRFSVPSIAAGQHELRVNVIDQLGNVLHSSAVRTINVE